MPERGPPAWRRSSFFGARGVWGDDFPGRTCLLPLPLGGPGAHVGRACRRRGGGSPGRGSTWGRGRDVHVAPVPGCRASRIRAGAALPGTGCVSAAPAISGLCWGPLAWRWGLLEATFLRALGEFFPSCVGLQRLPSVDGGLFRCSRSAAS